MLAGHQQEMQAERDRKLEAAREQRKNRRQRGRVKESQDHQEKSVPRVRRFSP